MNRIEYRAVRCKHIAEFNPGKVRQLMNDTILTDVRYQVRVAMTWAEDDRYIDDRDPRKHLDIWHSRLRKGDVWPVSLGVSGCMGHVSPCIYGTEEGYYDGQGITYEEPRMFLRFKYPVLKFKEKGERFRTFCGHTLENGIVRYKRFKDITAAEWEPCGSVYNNVRKMTLSERYEDYAASPVLI